MATGGRRFALGLTAVLALQALATAGVLAPTAGAQSAEPYHNYQTMKEDMQALAQEHDEIANFRIVGTSTLGLEMFAVDVANDVGNRTSEELATLPTLYVDGTHHGNELLSAEAAYYFLERVLANASEDPSYLEGKRLVVNPTVNPDGYARDSRTNTRQVDLNRNYPFHWGLYGTSEVPGHPNYRGMSPASEVETQANIELMKSLNLYAYVTGHTGTYDLVLPWDESQDGEMPDWPLYNRTLSHVENETGLSYRAPSGAGESTAYAYGNRSAFAILPEVSTEQFNPASTEDVEQRLNEVLNVYRITWENLTHLGGSIHVREATQTSLTLHNDGWGPAYNVTVGDEAIDRIAANQTITIDRPASADQVRYERVTVPGDDPSLALKTVNLGPATQRANGTSSGADEGLLEAPAVGPLALVGLLLTAAAGVRSRPKP